MRAAVFFLAVLLVPGCGDDGSGTGDAAVADGARADAETGLGTPAPPEPPATPAEAMLPNLLPCPAGWREVSGGEASVCDPWPDTGVADCPAIDEAHFLGEPGCRRVGTVAGSDGWPTGIPAGTRVVYVRAGAPAGGDGSAPAPYPDLRTGLGAALSGDVVAIGAGTYDEGLLTIPPGITLWGASVAGTEITRSGTLDLSTAVVRAGGADVTLRNLRITGNKNGIEVTGRTRSITLVDVVIDGVEAVGLYAADGATVTVRGSVFRDIRSLTGMGRLGRGASVENGATASVEGSVFIRCRAEAVTTSVNGTLVLRDTAIVDTSVRSMDLQRGYGVLVLEADVDLERVGIVRSAEAGIDIGNPGATGRIVDVAIRESTGRPTDGVGRGLVVDFGAVVDASRVSIEDMQHAGVFVDVVDTQIALSDAVVRGVRALDRGSPQDFGRGIMFQNEAGGTLARTLVEDADNYGYWLGGVTVTGQDVVAVDVPVSAAEPEVANGFGVLRDTTVTLDRARFERAARAGIGGESGMLTATDLIVRDVPNGIGIGAQQTLVADVTRALVERVSGIGVNSALDGAVLRIADVTVSDVGPRPADGQLGIGAVATMGGELDVRRALISNVRGTAVALDSSTVRLFDVDVRDVQLRTPDAILAAGLIAQGGGSLEGQRVSIREATGSAVYARDATTALLVDLLVQDTRGSSLATLAGVLGHGLSTVAGAAVDVRNARLTGNRAASVLVGNVGSSVTLTDVVVTATLERECAAAGTCPNEGAGTGVVAIDGGRVVARRFEVSDSALAGVQVVRAGEMDLSEGEVTGNAIGANVQIEGYDIARLMDGVRYRDNGINLDATVLPVPDSPDVTTSTME